METGIGVRREMKQFPDWPLMNYSTAKCTWLLSLPADTDIWKLLDFIETQLGVKADAITRAKWAMADAKQK